MNGAPDKVIMAGMASQHMAKVCLKGLRTLGTSREKLENSTSLEMEPQDMSIWNMWQRMAWDIWRERPPKEAENIMHRLKFSRTGREWSK